MKPKIIKVLTYEKLDEIYKFLRKEILGFKNMNVPNQDIRVLMPESVIEILKNFHRGTYSEMNYLDSELYKRIYQVEFLPHYKNEIVVYCTKFDFYEDINSPKIFEL